MKFRRVKNWEDVWVTEHPKTGKLIEVAKVCGGTGWQTKANGPTYRTRKLAVLAHKD